MKKTKLFILINIIFVLIELIFYFYNSNLTLLIFFFQLSFVFFCERYLKLFIKPKNSEWKGTPKFSRSNWNILSVDKTEHFIKSKLKKFDKIEQAQFANMYVTKFISKKSLSNIYGIYIIKTEVLTEKEYTILQKKIKKGVYTFNGNNVAILIVNKHNEYYEKFLKEFSIYQPLDVGMWNDMPKASLIVLGICIYDREIVSAVLPYIWYKDILAKFVKMIGLIK